MKGRELTDESNVKLSTEQNPKNVLHCSTDNVNDDSEPQNIAKEVV